MKVRKEGAEGEPTEEPKEKVETEEAASETFEVGDPVETDSAKAEEARASRAEKKRERLNLMDELKSVREDNARLANEMRALATRPVYVQPAPEQPKDPVDDEMDRAYSDQRSLLVEFNALGEKISPEQLKDYEKRSRDIEERKYRAIARREMRDSGVGRGPSEQQQAASAMQARYPEVMNNPKMKAWARGEYLKLRAEDMPDSWDTIERVMQATRTKFGIGRRAAPSDADRSRHTSVGRAGASGSRGSSGFEMTPALKKIADKAFPHIADEKARYQKWVNDCSEGYMAERAKSA